jgi:nifR3 family TIM-barrel protein
LIKHAFPRYSAFFFLKVIFVMIQQHPPLVFSQPLQKKIDHLKSKRRSVRLGRLESDSKLVLAPMAAICNAPFRLLMETLGAGLTVSELISAHGINYKNDHTLKMLRIDPREKNVGIQLFGEEANSLRAAAEVAQEAGAKWIDLNMGCPVKKVVTKGAGAALLRQVHDLSPLLETIKKNLQVPLTIKIRLGWDSDELNAAEIAHIAYNSGVEFVAIHGRTRAQGYSGEANWEFIDRVCLQAKLPIIGNGDLHSPLRTFQQLQVSSCHALMLGRGPLRNPFIFLESLDSEAMREMEKTKEYTSLFTGADYWEVILMLKKCYEEHNADERYVSVQIRKFIAWYSAGYPNSVALRQKVFSGTDLLEVMKEAQKFFEELKELKKSVHFTDQLMSSGHG